MIRKTTNKYTYIIIILSVLLTISLVVGGTFAWFASSDQASVTITLGDPVNLHIIDAEGGKLADHADLPVTISGPYLLPGMKMTMYAAAQFSQSNTPALLRAKFSISIEGGSATESDVAILQSNMNVILNSVVKTTGTSGKWMHNNDGAYADNWWYYIGVNNVQGTKANTIAQRIDNSNAAPLSRIVEFIDSDFIFPTNAGNIFANSNIQISVTFQAVQAYLPSFGNPAAPDPEDDPAQGFKYRYNRIKNIIEVFNETFGT